jgi:hypothetical protein
VPFARYASYIAVQVGAAPPLEPLLGTAPASLAELPASSGPPLSPELLVAPLPVSGDPALASAGSGGLVAVLDGVLEAKVGAGWPAVPP